MLRVLQCIESLSPGGVETFVMNYYRNVDREKVQFDFLVKQAADISNHYEDEILKLGGRIYRLPIKAKGIFVLKFFKILKENNYKVIHCHSNIFSVFYLLTAFFARVPKRIAHSHNTSVNRGLLYPAKMILKPFVSLLATDRFACGEAAGKWLFGKKSFTVIKNAVDVQQYAFNETIRSEKRRELSLKDETVFINVGRFTQQKNHIFLIEIFSELVKLSDKEQRLILVGDGELRTEILHKIDELGLTDKVLVLGIRDDISELLSASDIFLLPSLFEGLPFTLIEAQSSGIDCYVSSGVPSDAKILDNYFVFNLENSPLMWAKNINFNFTRKREAYANIIKKNGFDIKINAEKLEIFYLG